MNKKEACHRLAEINEEIFELENLLTDVKSRLVWDDESRREWYLKREKELIADLARCKQEHNAFISEYSDVIYS